jgi:hypothetical protein
MTKPTARPQPAKPASEELVAPFPDPVAVPPVTNIPDAEPGESRDDFKGCDWNPELDSYEPFGFDWGQDFVGDL